MRQNFKIIIKRMMRTGILVIWREKNYFTMKSNNRKNGSDQSWKKLSILAQDVKMWKISNFRRPGGQNFSNLSNYQFFAKMQFKKLTKPQVISLSIAAIFQIIKDFIWYDHNGFSCFSKEIIPNIFLLFTLYAAKMKISRR